MSTAEYGVDSFHINVSDGEAAFHLLVNRSEEPCKILSTVLIDGGHATMVSRTTNTRNAISQSGDYKLPDGATTLKCDAIVITQWDEDHYGGILKLIRNSLRDDGTDNIDTSIFKYGGAGRSDPKTYLYVPTTFEVAGDKTKDFDIWVDQATVHLKGRWLNNEIWVDCEAGKIKAKGICKLRTENFLGVNFFVNRTLRPPSASVGNPATLIERNPPNLPDGTLPSTSLPGIYCIATNTDILGRRINSSSQKRRVGTGKAPVVALDDNTTTNRESICAMIIWNSGRLSHYMGGGLDSAEEKKIVDWSQTNGGVDQKGKWVTSMKVSHHRTHWATPVPMLQNFRPKNIVLSCGSRHMHPAYELILYMAAQQMKLGKAAWDHPILPTVYPYWFQRSKSAHGIWKYIESIDDTSFTSVDVTSKNYIKQLNDMFISINKASTKNGGPMTPYPKEYNNFCEKYSAMYSDSREAGIFYLMDTAAKYWANGNLSYIQEEFNTVGNGYWGPTQKQGRDNNAIIHIKIRISDNERDGEVFIATKKAPFGIPLRPANTTVASTDVDMTATRNSANSAREKGGTPAMADPTSSDPTSSVRKVSQDSSTSGASTNKSKSDNSKASKASSGADTSSSSKPHHIYCTDVPSSAQVSGATTLSTGSELDSFVKTVHNGVLGLTHKPDSTDDGKWISIVGDDELTVWFQNTFIKFTLAIGSFSVRWSSSNNSISGFKLELGGKAALTFETDAIASSFTTSEGISSTNGVTQTNVVILGLNPKCATFKVKFQDVIEMAGFGAPNNDLFGTLGDIKLVLDPSKTGKRNAIWFDPSVFYKTSMRLQFDVDGTDKTLSAFFSFVSSDKIAVTTKYAVLITIATFNVGKGVRVRHESEVFLRFDCTIKPSSSESCNFRATLSFSGDLITIRMKAPNSAPNTALAVVRSWLGQARSDFTTNFEPWTDWLRAGSTSLRLRQLELVIDVNKKTKKRRIKFFRIKMEMVLAKVKGIIPVVFLTYTWPDGKIGRLRGSLWPLITKEFVLPAELYPKFEDFLESVQFTPGSLSPSIDLTTVIPGVTIKNIPNMIPSQIQNAGFTIEDGTIAVFGDIRTKTKFIGPIIYDEVGFSFLYNRKLKVLDVALSLSVLLRPPPAFLNAPPVVLTGQVHYSKETWTLSASLHDASAAYLYALFDSDSQNGISSFLYKIWLREVNITYKYPKSGSEFSSSILLDGVLVLGELEMDLTYKKIGTSWIFRATIGGKGGTTTLGSIVDSICDVNLPSFIGNIVVKSAGDSSDCQLLVRKVDDYIIFSVDVRIGSLKVTMLQISEGSWSGVKRVLKVNMGGTPDIKLPLIDALDFSQPFEQISYLWVDDKSNSNESALGFTRSEVYTMNNAGILRNDKFFFRETQSNTQPDAVVLAIGFHFQMMIQEGLQQICVIDYVFAVQTKRENAATKDSQAVAQGEDQTKALTATGESAMGSINRTQGSLTITNIGLHFVESTETLFIIMDATFALGPIRFALLGFGIGIALENFSLQRLGSHLRLSLSGVGISFDQPPVNLAGLLEYKNDSLFEGGAIVSTEQYMFMGAGMYGKFASPVRGQDYTSVFALGRLEGPLVSFEIGEISGVTVGFGYNSSVRTPTQNDVTSFPFVESNVTIQSNSLSTLERLFSSGWITPNQGNYWLAAGMKVDALQMFSIDAVAIVQFGQGFKISLVADGVYQVPPANSPSNRKFVYVELGIVSTVDFDSGVLLTAGQLSPFSYILDPSCHLSGQFAFFYWFGDNAHAGNWALTIGGYHPRFLAPSYYPHADRLQIGWSVDNNISITGQSYFAITPKICMAGGVLRVAYVAGNFEAGFTAWADFIMNYEPFSFRADVSVNIHAQYTTTVWFVSHTFYIGLAATLHLEGPPLHGSVYVSWTIFSVTINFGTRADQPPPLDLAGFCKLLKAESGHVFTCEAGLIPNSEGQQVTQKGATWLVRGGNLSFKICSPFAFESATFNSGSKSGISINYNERIYARPMHLASDQRIQSTLSVTISYANKKIDKTFRMDTIFKKAPVGLWGAYDPHDPTILDGQINPTCRLLFGITLTAPTSIFPITSIFPYNILTSATLKLFAANETPAIPTTAPDPYAKYWEPGEPDEDVKKQYKAVEKAWNKKGLENKRKGVLEGFKDALRWGEIVGLKVQPPSIALGEFEVVYASAPFLGLGE